MIFRYNNTRRKHAVKARTKTVRFGPVYIDVKKKIVSFREKKWKIEFTKSDIKRWIQKRVRQIAPITMVGVTFWFLFVATPGSARMVTFYPETCLGGWENPDYAEGKPDVLSGSRKTPFRSTNSAMNRDVVADIFCGNFKGVIPDGGTMRTATLSFSMYIGDIVEQKDGTFVSKPAQQSSKASVSSKEPIKSGEAEATSSEEEIASDTATGTIRIEGDLIDNFYEILDASPEDEIQLTFPDEPTVEDIETIEDIDTIEEPIIPHDDPVDEADEVVPSGIESIQPLPEEVAPIAEDISSADTVESIVVPSASPEPTESGPVSWLHTIWQTLADGIRVAVAYATTEDESVAPGATTEPVVLESVTENTVDAPLIQDSDEPAPDVVPIEVPEVSEESEIIEEAEVHATTSEENVENDESLDVPDSRTTLFDEYLGVPEAIILPDVENGEVIENDVDVSSTTEATSSALDATDDQAVVVEKDDTPVQSQDTLFMVEYSFNGTDWVVLGEVTARNWETVSFELPFVSWESIGSMQVRLVKPISFDQKPAIMLDAMVVKVSYAKDKAERSLIEKHSDIQSFQTTEDPSFEFEYRIKNENRFKDVVNTVVPVFPLDREFSVIKAEVDDASGNTQAVETELDLGMNDTWKAIIPKDARALRPGKYTFNVTTQHTDGEVLTEQKEFYWGVLTINTNKSIFEPHEEAHIQMGALDDMGRTLCDASLELEVRNPKGESTFFNVEDDSILMSGVCDGDTVVDVPDYSSRYVVGEAGTYQMRLINHDTGFEVLDSFKVQDDVPFVIERFGPTRIFPPATYEMVIEITAKQDFTGEMYEYVPSGFEISEATGTVHIRDEMMTETTNVEATTTDVTTDVVRATDAPLSESSVTFIDEYESDESDTKELLWKVSFKAGESITLRYVFDAPDISPEVFLLGPLQLYE